MSKSIMWKKYHCKKHKIAGSIVVKLNSKENYFICKLCEDENNKHKRWNIS